MLSGDEATAVLDRQTAVMEQLASGASLPLVLDSVVRSLEELMPNSQCSILLLDDGGFLRHGAAPSLPTAYSEAIDGLAPGPAAGSCGTAVHLDDAVVAVDVSTDGRWDDFRALAERHELRACWSSPIRTDERVVGTFAVYHRAPYEPDDHDTELVDRFTHLASMAVAHDRAVAERQARREADLAREAAERANLAKSQFVTSLSHELRTPLQAITGFTENLETLDLTPGQRRDALERIRVASAHILAIVDDVLDLARVEAGAIPITVVGLSVDEVIAAAVALVQPLADRRQVGVVVAGDGPHARGDQRRLQQVLINLLANAVRFSPVGGSVRVEVTDHDRRVSVAVVDDGPGISPELLDRLFVPFDRLGADAGREGGAGLGLVLARRLSEAMGGTLELDSTVGVGTRATVSLPAAPPPPDAPAGPA